MSLLNGLTKDRHRPIPRANILARSIFGF